MFSKVRIQMSVVALAMGALTPTASFAHGAGNGGEAFAAQFVQTGSLVADAIGKLGGAIPEVRESEFRDAVLGTSVLPFEGGVLGPDGQPRDATNDPAGRVIKLDVKRWRGKPGAYEKLKILIHEYLGIARLEPSDQYARTLAILGRFQKNEATIGRLDDLIASLPPKPSLSGSWKCRSTYPAGGEVPRDWGHIFAIDIKPKRILNGAELPNEYEVRTQGYYETRSGSGIPRVTYSYEFTLKKDRASPSSDESKYFSASVIAKSRIYFLQNGRVEARYLSAEDLELTVPHVDHDYSPKWASLPINVSCKRVSY